MNRVAVVVLNYKGIEDTAACISSLVEQTYDNFSIIIVENGSHDGSTEKLKKLQQKHKDLVHVIYNDKNLGFDGGVNTGIRWALEKEYKYIALFNNDAIADKNWIKHLVATAEKQNSGLTTGLLLLADGKKIDIRPHDWVAPAR